MFWIGRRQVARMPGRAGWIQCPDRDVVHGLGVQQVECLIEWDGA